MRRRRPTDTALSPPTGTIFVLDIGRIPLAAAPPRRVAVLASDAQQGLALSVMSDLLGIRATGVDANAAFQAQLVELTESDVYTSGRRCWLTCPGLNNRPCGSRRRKLYLPPGESAFACTDCHGIQVPHSPSRALRWRDLPMRPEVLRWREQG